MTEAARIDGCSELQILMRIVLPLSKSALLVVAIFQFMATWNDFLAPLIFLTEQKDFTLALGLQSFQSQNGGTAWHQLMAASTLVALPIILLFSWLNARSSKGSPPPAGSEFREGPSPWDRSFALVEPVLPCRFYSANSRSTSAAEAMSRPCTSLTATSLT